MTTQTYDELHDEAKRVHPDVEQRMKEKHESDNLTDWWVEYEAPAETNGWIYYGNPGGAAVTHSWRNSPNPDEATEAVVLHHTSTHPHDDSCDVLRVYHTDDLEDKTHRGETIAEIDGEPYRTPLYVRRRMFWQGVEAAIEWMEANDP